MPRHGPAALSVLGSAQGNLEQSTKTGEPRSLPSFRAEVKACSLKGKGEGK